MAVLYHTEIKIKKDKKDEFVDLLKSPEGFPTTKSKPGLITLESGVSTDDSGQSTVHIWCKWEKMEDFENYLKDPNRNEPNQDPESEYAQKQADMTDGPLKMVWLEIIE